MACLAFFVFCLLSPFCLQLRLHHDESRGHYFYTLSKLVYLFLLTMVLFATQGVLSPVFIIALTEVFDGTVPSKFLFPYPWNPYLNTDGTSLPVLHYAILFLVKNFEEKEIEFWKERFCQKLLSNNDNNCALVFKFLISISI